MEAVATNGVVNANGSKPGGDRGASLSSAREIVGGLALGGGGVAALTA
jgi:hypothetical protein